jgi:hypothetical protein
MCVIKNRMIRDYQRTKVYTAENTALGFYKDTMTFEEAVEVSLRLLNSNMVADMINDLEHVTPPCEVFEIRSGDKRSTCACANSEYMRLPKGTRNLPTICHELAHVLTIDNSTEPNYAYHGEEFCEVYLKLVQKFIGDDAHTDLLAAFIIHNVNC